MKKLLGILVLAFLFSGNANAGVNEPGSGPITSILEIKRIHKEHLEKVKKKNQHLIYYVSAKGELSESRWAGWALHAKKINEEWHKKSYKKCMEYAAEYTQEDCFLFAIDDKIVWNLDGPVKRKEESAEAKAEKEKQMQIDKKPGRFFEDQPDVNDDYQIHFIYLHLLFLFCFCFS